MSGLIVPRHIAVERADRPIAPPWAQDVAETYARQYDRHGKVEWAPAPLNCWYVRLSLISNDPMLALVQRQAVEEQFEDVFLHEPSTDPRAGKTIGGKWHPRYIAKDLEQMGPSGLREFLDRGNTRSGRGEFTSLTHAVQTARSNHEQEKEKKRKTARDNTLDRVMDRRRTMYQIPFLRVGIDLKQPPQ